MNTIYLVANGDARLSANQKCQEAQAAMEAQVVVAIEREGGHVQRAHPFDAEKGHGFIDGQKYGMEVFRRIPKDAPLVVAAAAWQYSQHILPGLLTHEGPILTIANWSGTWPGLVGLLNLNGSMIRAGIKFSSLWSATFEDKRFCRELRRWLEHGKVKHDTSHVRKFQAKHDEAREFADAVATGRDFARRFRAEQAIMGVFDEGCMGMYNAIIPDALLQSTGVFKERLSQAALYARMQTVGEAEARAVFEWYRRRGLQFHFGSEEMTDLTESQVLQQCRMYVATLRIADEFGCATIGIQYQQGLKDLTPASDLVEGSLNNVDRPPVYHEVTGEEILPGEALPHFNEVDECAGLDGLVTYRLWRQLGLPPENTLHDLRWGRHFADGTRDEYVWVFLISGAVPPEHLVGGWAGATSERQPPMYFRLGGGTIKGISKPGWIVWSRVFVEAEERLCYDLGLAEVVELPAEETEDRWQSTTPQWPIMHAVLQGISRDQMMARHASNHIQVVYAPTKEAARHGLFAKAAAMHELGLKVSLCGHV
jgi:hypothetical protein